MNKNNGYLILAVVLLVGAVYAIGFRGAVTQDDAVNSSIAAVGGDVPDTVVRIPLTEISTTVKKYTYNSGGTAVRYMAVLGSDGKVRTAFDACEICGGSLGYRQSGDDAVCNKCGRHFSIDSLGTENRGGGCWPSDLPHKVSGQYVLIEQSDLEAGKRFFQG
ncbi:MAG: DUF2318 domain-containing protein [Candidatus Altiarchaeota archaeon]